MENETCKRVSGMVIKVINDDLETLKTITNSLLIKIVADTTNNCCLLDFLDG